MKEQSTDFHKKINRYTMKDLVDTVAQSYTDIVALKTYRDDESEITYGKLKQRVDALGFYLTQQGVEKGDRIAILAESTPNWAVMYFGITSIGAIAVPLLPDFSAREVQGILEHSGCKGAAVNVRHFEKCKSFVTENFLLFRIEDLFHIPSGISETLTTQELFEHAPGRDITRLKPKKNQIDILSKRTPGEHDVASIIYTSGTTGTPKGVVLTHKNLVWNADVSTDQYVKIKKGYRVLSILPLSHVYEFTIGLILPLLTGCSIQYLGKPPAVSILLPALKEVRPHIMLSVPLLIEKVYTSAVLPKLRDNTKLRPWLKFWLTRRFIYRTIGRKLKMTFGARLKFFGIGGAPLDGNVEAFLHKANFPYAIGYGLTETSPLLAACGPHNQHVGCIGKAVPGVTLRLEGIDSETGVGEVQAKGPNIMVGYYDNKELTDEAFTEDGWFKTGDLGAFDRKNRLSIKGRLKTMILGPSGENIYPESIESVINNQSFVQESLVIPENGGLLAMIKLDLEQFAEKMALNVQDVRDEAAKYIASLREAVNKDLGAHSKLDEVELQEEPFQRTPTQKIKRYLYSLGRGKKKDDTEGKSEPN